MAKITYEQESDDIRENKKKPEAAKPHDFKGAVWTHPNGHPRCLVCGDEQSIGDRCNESEAFYREHSEKIELVAKLSEVLTLCKQVIEAPVSELGLAREDLGVRRDPKPHNKLPEAC